MKTLYVILFLIVTSQTLAQHLVSGRVTNKNGLPIQGANVYLEGTYDGATTNAAGEFSFSTPETGEKILITSFLSYETFRIKMQVAQMKHLHIKLADDVTALDAVVLSAGTFSAGDNSRVSVLKPLDVVTTAGVAGDFIAALQTLPGTQTVGEDGRLFVRGGTPGETGIFIDGMKVFQPYTASAQNLPSRGRYSPFLFDGITFSTGGYAAEYGNALSGVLLLNTINEPTQTETNISLMSVGGGIGHTQKWQNSSLSLNTSYLNLAPYLEIVKNNEQANFTKPYQSLSGEAVARKGSKNGLFKAYAAYELSSFELLQPNIHLKAPQLISLKNGNFYTNFSYKGVFGNGWSIYPGASFSYSINDLKIDETPLEDKEIAAHFKLKLNKRFSSRIKLNFGGEHVFTTFSEGYASFPGTKVDPHFSAVFAESDLIFSKNFAAKAGFRGTYLDLQKEFFLAPRLALALKAGNNGQISLAYGDYWQQASTEVLKYDRHLQPEKATHTILNYQWTKPGYTMRAEAYHKSYSNLVKYNTGSLQMESDFSNTGAGFARGIDLFYRDNKSINNLQFWLSYSFIIAKRNFEDYPQPATPQFVANHAASIVTKYWLGDWKSQLGFAYNFASGRPFQNPNLPGFMNDRTRSYGSLNFNWAYLLSPQKILYFSVSNLTGRQNVFNYEYAASPNSEGIFERHAIIPAADRFFFVGFFWTISKNKTSNQLDNL